MQVILIEIYDLQNNPFYLWTVSKWIHDLVHYFELRRAKMSDGTSDVLYSIFTKPKIAAGNCNRLWIINLLNFYQLLGLKYVSIHLKSIYMLIYKKQLYLFNTYF